MFNQLSPGSFFFVCLCNFVVFPSSAAYSGDVCSTRSSFTESTINSSPSRRPGQTPKQPQLARYQTAACFYPMAKLLTPSEGETRRCPHTHTHGQDCTQTRKLRASISHSALSHQDGLSDCLSPTPLMNKTLTWTSSKLGAHVPSCSTVEPQHWTWG